MLLAGRVNVCLLLLLLVFGLVFLCAFFFIFWGGWLGGEGVWLGFYLGVRGEGVVRVCACLWEYGFFSITHNLERLK